MPHVWVPGTQTVSPARRTTSSKALPATPSAQQINTSTPQTPRAQIAHKTAQLAPRPPNVVHVRRVTNC